MASPTSYSVTYPDPDDFCKSGPCGSGECAGVLYFNVRPQNFCEDVVLQKDVVVNGSLSVTPAEITVGGLTFRPGVVITLEGPVTVLRL